MRSPSHARSRLCRRFCVHHSHPPLAPRTCRPCSSWPFATHMAIPVRALSVATRCAPRHHRPHAHGGLLPHDFVHMTIVETASPFPPRRPSVAAVGGRPLRAAPSCRTRSWWPPTPRNALISPRLWVAARFALRHPAANARGGRPTPASSFCRCRYGWLPAPRCAILPGTLMVAARAPPRNPSPPAVGGHPLRAAPS